MRLLNHAHNASWAQDSMAPDIPLSKHSRKTEVSQLRRLLRYIVFGMWPGIRWEPEIGIPKSIEFQRRASDSCVL
jgi:hypothetical protein